MIFKSSRFNKMDEICFINIFNFIIMYANFIKVNKINFIRIFMIFYNGFINFWFIGNFNWRFDNYVNFFTIINYFRFLLTSYTLFNFTSRVLDNVESIFFSSFLGNFLLIFRI